jgi:hypothetical protein
MPQARKPAWLFDWMSFSREKGPVQVFYPQPLEVGFFYALHLPVVYYCIPILLPLLLYHGKPMGRSYDGVERTE